MTAPTFTQPGGATASPTAAAPTPAAAPAPTSVGVTHEIPPFEGQEVSFTKAKVTSVSGLEIGDAVMKMDDMVEMRVTGRILGVDHKVNAAGKLERVHLIKAIETDLIKSWDASGRETTY